jgi:hypothetical protein
MSQVLDGASFSLDPKGLKAWRRLLKMVGEGEQGALRCLKLNMGETQEVTDRFPSMIRKLVRVEEMDRVQLVDLFKTVTMSGYSEERLDSFKRFLTERGEPWVRGKPPSQLTRNDFYREFILPDDVVDTSKPGIDSRKMFAYELKLIADLAYNNNVPTTLRRQSFVPTELPSPLCLPRELFSPGLSVNGLAQDVASHISDRLLHERVVYKSQEAFVVPDWADLTVRDVRKIRAWDEWEHFDKAFRSLVDSTTPDKFFDQVSELNSALQSFHQKLSREIDADRGFLRHLRTGSKVFFTVLHPVLIWAGTPVLGPGAAAIVASGAHAVEFGIEMGLGFLEKRHQDAHDAEIEGFLYRAAGVRKNVSTSLETAAQRTQVEKLAEQRAVVPSAPPAQVA